MGGRRLASLKICSTLKATQTLLHPPYNRLPPHYQIEVSRHLFSFCDSRHWIADLPHASPCSCPILNHRFLQSFAATPEDLSNGTLEVNQANLRALVDSASLFLANETPATSKIEAASQQEALSRIINESSSPQISNSASGCEASSFDSENSADDGDEDDAFSLLKRDSIELDITLFGKLGKSEAAIAIYQILKTEKWSSPDTEEKLSSVTSRVSPELVVEVVKLLRNAPVALSFLNWAKNQVGYETRAEAYTHVIARFGRERDFNSAWSLLVEMKGCKLPVDFVFSIFVHRLKRAKRVQGVVKAMCGMAFLGVTPTISLYTSALEFLFKVGAGDDAMHLYKQMMQDNLVPDKKLFEILSVGFLKLGKVDDGLLLFEEMKNRGYTPHVSVYSLLVSTLSMAKMPDRGHELFYEMIKTGSIPKVFGVNEIACALHGKDKPELLEMILKLIERTPYKWRIQSHNNLLQYLFDCGRCTEAKTMFETVPQDKAAQPAPRKGVINYWNLNSYHIYITGMCKLGQLSLGIIMFKEMQERGVEPSIEICSFLLLSLSDSKMVDEALAICKHITRLRIPISIDAQKSFFIALRTSEHLSVALKIFASMKRKGCVDEHADFVSLIGLEKDDGYY